jgi:hypothetical protein
MENGIVHRTSQPYGYQQLHNYFVASERKHDELCNNKNLMSLAMLMPSTGWFNIER